VPTNKQRREASRRHLERQLQRRQEREARQRKVTLITSIVATLVLIAVIVVVVVAFSGDDKKSTTTAAKSTKSPSASPSVSPSSSAPAMAPPSACTKPAKGSTDVFDGVTVKDPTNLKVAPKTTSKSAKEPATLECQDLVVGKGKAATPTSTVNVQYAGVLYKNGKAFDSSWAKGGKPVQFALTGVVPGFTFGIGGTGKVTPMKVGGRRIIIMPAALGYGSSASGPVPANSSLVFVVDLTSVSAATSSSPAG
jgi:FKBP-type peptidyl-prolyl cis-trans isomerase